MKYTLGLPGVILKLVKGSPEKSDAKIRDGGSVISLSREEKGMRKILNAMLLLSVNNKEGYITLTAIAPEALAAAQIAQKAQQLLQEQVTEFKIDKARQKLVFAMARTEEEKLQSEYQLAFTVYS